MEVETYPLAWSNRPSVDSWEMKAPACTGADARDERCRALALARIVERGLETSEVGGPEHNAILSGHIDKIEVDSSPGDLASQVRQHAGPILDIDYHNFALASDRDMGNREGVLGGLGVRDEYVELSALACPDAGGRCNVHAGVADRGSHLRQRPGTVLDVDYEIDCHLWASAYWPFASAPSTGSSSLV